MSEKGAALPRLCFFEFHIGQDFESVPWGDQSSVVKVV